MRAVKTRIECRGQKEPRNPRQWLEINSEGKVQATENQKSESTLFYLVPIGLRKIYFHSGHSSQLKNNSSNFVTER